MIKNISYHILYLICLLILSSLISISDSAVVSGPPLQLIEKKPIELSCNLTDERGEFTTVEWQWTKDGKSYEDFSFEDKQRIIIRPETRSLVITSAKIEDIGVWQCLGSGQSKRIQLYARPWLYPFEEYQKTNYKSANVIEGQRFQLRCRVLEGYERNVSIQWFRYNESEHPFETKNLVPIRDEDDFGRIRIEKRNRTEEVLTIEKVVPSDRFYYVCQSFNGVWSSNNTILLRVKDKLGALWPFLGIVAEVVILCTIIFIYEKRRIKPDFDESDNENNTEPKATQDRSSKPQDVRQRK